MHSQCVLVDAKKITPPDRNDLDGSQIDNSDSWVIERAYGGGEGHRIYLDPPMSHPYSETLVGSEKFLFIGSAPGRGVIPTLARAEWSLARSSGEVRAGCWAAMDVLR